MKICGIASKPAPRLRARSGDGRLDLEYLLIVAVRKVIPKSRRNGCKVRSIMPA